MDFSTSFLVANLIWGSVGMGYFIFGKRQRAMMPMIGGLVMIAVSCVVNSALLMTLICLGVAAAVYILMKQGY